MVNAKSADLGPTTYNSLARPMITNANSPAPPSISPAYNAARGLSPSKGPSPAINKAFTVISKATAPSIKNGFANTFSKLIDIPIDTRKTPSNSPLNGWIVASTSRLYSVSASKSPAINAPIVIERPALEVARPVMITTRMLAAMKTSGPSISAAILKIGRKIKRPIITIKITTIIEIAKALIRPKIPSSLRVGDMNETANRIGIIAISWNNKMPKAARPSGAISLFLSAKICITIAVDDIAKAIPIINDAVGDTPKANQTISATPIEQENICKPPSVNTSFRIFFKRSKLSSSPIANKRNITPSSDIV